MALQPRRRQLVLGGTGIEGSSESESGGARDGVAGETGWGARGGGKFWTFPLVAIGFGGGGVSSGTSDVGGDSTLGVSSTMEWVPVVQGGIERNSSNVKNRGLQHFQPVPWSQPKLLESDRPSRGAPRHLSALHEIWVDPGDKCISLHYL